MITMSVNLVVKRLVQTDPFGEKDCVYGYLVVSEDTSRPLANLPGDAHSWHHPGSELLFSVRLSRLRPMGTLDISDMMSEGLRQIMSSAPRPSFAYVYGTQNI